MRLPAHLEMSIALRGRCLFFTRTPDGSWWRLRLRRCRRVCEDRAGWGDPPPDSAVREPRRPRGPDPHAGAVALGDG